VSSLHAGITQGGEPVMRQLLQQPKPTPKPTLQLKQQSERQSKPNPQPKATPPLAIRWKTVQFQTQSHNTPADPGLTVMSEACMPEGPLD
jgi:hypothetical protein